MSSSRNKGRRDQHRAELKRRRTTSSSLNIEVPQRPVYNDPDIWRSHDFVSSPSTQSYLNSSCTSGQAATPSGTTYSPYDSNVSEYQSIYGTLNSNPSQQYGDSSQGAELEFSGQRDAYQYPATQESVNEASDLLENDDQSLPFVPTTMPYHWPNEDPPNHLPYQNDSTALSVHQPWLAPTTDPHVLQNHGQPTVIGYYIDRAYVGWEPRVEENPVTYNQIQPLPSGPPTYYHQSQVPPGEPWTPWNVPDEQVSNQSTFANDTVMLEQELHPLSAITHKQNVPSQTFLGTNHDGHYLQASATDSVEAPPSDNPIGFPTHFGPSNDQQFVYEGQAEKRRVGKRQGRLHPASAKNACKMRKEHVCMSCRILREACVFDDDDPVCRHCKHKISISGQRICDRTQLPQLVQVFLPDILLGHLTYDALQHFARCHIAGYVDPSPSPISVQLTAGFGLTLTIEAHEVNPSSNWMEFSAQFRPNNQAQKYKATPVPSPCLVMTFVGENSVQEWRVTLKDTLEKMLSGSFADIPRKCFPGQKEPNRIFRRMMKLLHKYYRDCPKKTKHVPFLCLELIMMSYMLDRAFTLVEETRYAVWQQLRNRPEQPFGPHTSARYVNKQLKHLLSTLIKDLLEKVLASMQKQLGASKKDSWTPAFAILSTIAMVAESFQLSIRLREHIDRKEGSTASASDATSAILDIEKRLHYLTDVFHDKYTGHKNKSWNPLCSRQTRNDLEDHDREFVQGMWDMIQDHSEHLKGLASQPPVPAIGEDGKIDKPQGRLLSQFFLPFIRAAAPGR